MIVEIRDEEIALSGALRRNHWRTLESAVRLRLRAHPDGIVVDCSGISAITADGAETFQEAIRHIEARGARLVIAGVRPEVHQVLRQTAGLGSRLPVAATVEEGRVSLGLPRSRSSADSSIDLVGLLGTEADQEAVALAARLQERSAAQRPRLLLVFPLTVPRDRPLLSALDKSTEEQVRLTLTRFEGSLRERGILPVLRAERTRDRARRLIEVAVETRAARIILGIEDDPDEEIARIVEVVWTKSPTPVLIHQVRRRD